MRCLSRRSLGMEIQIVLGADDLALFDQQVQDVFGLARFGLSGFR